MTNVPVYVSRPSNLDVEEAYAIIFLPPKDGPVFDPEEAERFFGADARRIARLLAARCNMDWRTAFSREWTAAAAEVDEYFDTANDEEATVEAFIGEPVEQFGNMSEVRNINIELAS